MTLLKFSRTMPLAGALAVTAQVLLVSHLVATPPSLHAHDTLSFMAAADSDPAAVRPKSSVQPIACNALPDIPGKSITTIVVTFPPNGFTPRHRHPGSVTAFVLTGTIRSQLLGGPAGLFKPGQSFFEPPGAVHLFAENASTTEPASLLATFVTDHDCGPLTIFD